MSVLPAGSAPVSGRKRISREFRRSQHVARINWPPGRLAALRGIKTGRRCFLLGSGPSLAEVDLARLAGEDVCVLNMGVKALDQGLPNVAIHVNIDKNRYLRFADEIESYSIAHSIPLRFLGVLVRNDWRARVDKGAEPYYIFMRHQPIAQTGFSATPHFGYGSCGTVATIALQLLYFLGYSEVHVLGIDLDYSGEQPYFYGMTAKDLVHEADAKVVARRPLMDGANAEFGLARAAFESAGRRLTNAGRGGNLVALERSSLDDLLEQVAPSFGADEPHTL